MIITIPVRIARVDTALTGSRRAPMFESAMTMLMALVACTAMNVLRREQRPARQAEQVAVQAGDRVDAGEQSRGEPVGDADDSEDRARDGILPSVSRRNTGARDATRDAVGERHASIMAACGRGRRAEDERYASFGSTAVAVAGVSATRIEEILDSEDGTGEISPLICRSPPTCAARRSPELGPERENARSFGPGIFSLVTPAGFEPALPP